MRMHALHKERAHCALRQIGGVRADRGPFRLLAKRTAQPAHCLADGVMVDGLVVEPLEKRYNLVKPGTLASPNSWRNGRCSPRRTSALRRVQSS